MMKIGTHNGSFHCDEALGCALLRRTEASDRRFRRAATSQHPPAHIISAQLMLHASSHSPLSRFHSHRQPRAESAPRLRAAPTPALPPVNVHFSQKFRDAEIVRSRDPDVLAQCDIVIDVGGTYDASSLRFDHHQREFTDVFGNGAGGGKDRERRKTRAERTMAAACASCSWHPELMFDRLGS